MLINFTKYEALGNDFLVVEATRNRIPRKRLPDLAKTMCDRRHGVGADGVLYVAGSRSADAKADVYNSDGGWAEKSGNGLRILGLHLARARSRRGSHTVQMGGDIHRVTVRGKGVAAKVKAELGTPDFYVRAVPMKSRLRYHINAPIRVGGQNFPMTCLSVGNPHAVLFVENFEFDWQSLGRDIEHHRVFPERTNVEFARIINRHNIEVYDWERGAGATGSSGTGASAAVCAGVMLGVIDRECTVKFPGGNIDIHWRESDDLIVIAGPVRYVFTGEYGFK
jgi:diaminopimelate epimerase